ncbi:MAG: ribosome silencing factor, partial [Pseudomonadota bacterium]|nr:ribosome silencing factor [Pseudomonadota bacterium]
MTIVTEEKITLPAPETLRDMIVQTLDTNKAEQVVVVDLAGKSSLADYIVIASGTSARHLGALAHHVSDQLSKAGIKRIELEGMPQNDWVLVDGGDVILHLPAGCYYAVIGGAGYETVIEEFCLDPGETEVNEVDLGEAPGYLYK